MGLQEFLKPLNDVILEANALTEGRRPDYFNHLKSASDSLTALIWIAYTGKDCGTWNLSFTFEQCPRKVSALYDKLRGIEC